jgi:hypothetical protein
MLYVYRYLLYTGIKKNTNGIYSKYNTLFLNKNNNYDLLFIGSSRAEMHFNPKVFDSICHVNSFNFGISGASTKLNFILLKTYLNQHHHPKRILYNVDYFALDSDSDRILNFTRFFPYLSNSQLLEGLNKIDSRFYSFYINPIHSLPYTQFNAISNSLHGWFNIAGKYDSLMYMGYQTSLIQSFNDNKIIAPQFNTITRQNANYIDSIISLSKKHSIQLIAITSPFYQENLGLPIDKKLSLSKELNNLFMKHKTPYFDYSDSLISLNKIYFSDYLHLNKKGSTIFSIQLSHILNNNSSIKPFFNK